MDDPFPEPITVAEMYGDWDFDEAVAALDRSLSPRSGAALFDVVASTGLAADDLVLDIGGREGQHALVMAERFGCRVVAVDPVDGNIERGRELVADHPSSGQVELRLGSIEAIPLDDASVRLVFARDMLGHVADLLAGLGECRRVLLPGGAMVVFEVFATPSLSAEEARELCGHTATVPERLSVDDFEATVADVGLSVERREIIGSEFVEANQEAGVTPNYLLQISRLRRAREALVAELGEVPYRAVYGNALWSVYRILGKLESRIYVLRRPDGAS